MLVFCVAFLGSLCYGLENPMEDTSLFEGDMVLEPDQKWEIEHGSSGMNPNIPLAATKTSHWPKVVPYAYTDDINKSSYAIQVIQSAIADYEKYTCLRFVPRTTEREYLNFYVGGGKHGSGIDSMNVPYDYQSLMHYGRTAFGSGKTTIQTIDKSKQYTIGQRRDFSQLDILQMNLLYKCPGFTKPPPGTLPPIVTTKSVTTKPVTTKPVTGPDNGKLFIIRHVGGLCISVGTDSRLRLTSACDEAFTQTSGSSIQHIGTGKCFHPNGGSSRPPVDTNIVIYSGCDQSRLKFTFEYVKISTIAPPTTIAPQRKQFTIQHYNGKCITYNVEAKRLQLTSACNDRFELTSSKSLKHTRTGHCVRPEESRSNSHLTLTTDCSRSDTRFEQTSAFSLKHLSTAKCVHPLGGSINPSEGTFVVIYTGCGEKRLQFKIIMSGQQSAKKHLIPNCK
eukprot:gene10637-11765_t